MPRFRIKAGKHSQKVDTGKTDDAGNPIRTLRVYRAGEVVETDIDLVAKFGAAKFELLGSRGRRSDEEGVDHGQLYGPTEMPPSVAPGGQVSSGKQVSTPEGGSAAFAGPGSPDTVRSPKDLEGHAKAPVPPAGQHQPRAAQAPAPQGDEGKQPNFDQMSDADLQKYADDNKIDLKGARNRADRIKTVRGHGTRSA